MFFHPRKSDVVEKALNVSLQDPGRGGLLAQGLKALGKSIRAPALGPKPVGVGVRLGFGNRLQRL
jgi:hypothetical protein